MARKFSPSQDACILIVSLAPFASDQRLAVEELLHDEIPETIGASLAFHHLGGTYLHDADPSPMQPANVAVLAELLDTLTNLKLVITFGVAAHLSTIDAYGMGWARVPFRPGQITALPDGLALANFHASCGRHIETIAPLLTQTVPALTADRTS
ncbi:uracil-DNA glycosylase family protein [Asaia spathodeae]|uniref:Nucleoside 2-deoxyribosyltransferase n=1 Tax=Asaia spathodeae TaxID=657016 RepID=A0ABX2P0V7_9PROT|nr:hypothetical protein [Asaia spathodeae]GBR14135.1 hypothetical protein AA105894_0995 [Asaia spathodeae NBRC 105894]